MTRKEKREGKDTVSARMAAFKDGVSKITGKFGDLSVDIETDAEHSKLALDAGDVARIEDDPDSAQELMDQAEELHVRWASVPQIKVSAAGPDETRIKSFFGNMDNLAKSNPIRAKPVGGLSTMQLPKLSFLNEQPDRYIGIKSYEFPR